MYTEREKHLSGWLVAVANAIDGYEKHWQPPRLLYLLHHHIESKGTRAIYLEALPYHLFAQPPNRSSRELVVS